MAEEWAYFDTSILTKRYLNEAGSFRARILLRQYRCLTSVIASVELFSMLARRHFSGELSERVSTAIRSRVAFDRRQWEMVAISSELVRRAEELTYAHKIKALDAIHIASALLFEHDSGAHILFISADERQLLAAEAAGLRIERVR